jgi:hypothetical protein
MTPDVLVLICPAGPSGREAGKRKVGVREKSGVSEIVYFTRKWTGQDAEQALCLRPTAVWPAEPCSKFIKYLDISYYNFFKINKAMLYIMLSC